MVAGCFERDTRADAVKNRPCPHKNIFWQRYATTVLNERQVKVLNRLLDTAGEEFEQGIDARKYQSLAKVSKATATRDLAELLEKGCLSKLPGGGRSTRYTVLL